MNQNRKLRRFLSLALALVLPATLPLQALAAEPATGKEEVVYAKVDKGGMPKTVSVVNIFRLDADGKIVDYGDYTAVHNLNTTDPVKKEGDTITADGKKGVFYLQGDNPKAALPWDVRVSYMLDGQTITPDTLGGKSGRLNLHVTVGKNPAADPVFFKYYIVQITLQFPKDKVKILSAEGATQAVAGEKTVLNYTLLPNKEGDFRIEAQVNDFAMDALQATALPFNMNFDMPNISDYTKEFSQLRYAAIQLDDGAQQLKKGLATLTAGISKWQNGAYQYQDGVNQFAAGARQYTEGVTASVGGVQQLAGGLKQLSDELAKVPTYNKELEQGSIGMQKGLADFAVGLQGATLPTVDDAMKMAAGSKQLLEGFKTLATQTSSAGDIVKGLDASIAGINAVAKSLRDLAVGTTADYQNLLNAGVQDNGKKDLQNYLLGKATTLNAIADNLNGASNPQSLTNGLNGIKQGILAISSGANTSATDYTKIDVFIQQMPAMVQQLITMKEGIINTSGGYTKFHEGLMAYTTLMAQTVPGVMQQAAAGSAQAAAGLQQLSGAGPGMLSGINQLADGAGSLGGGAGELAGGTNKLAGGAAKLAGGTSQLRAGTNDMEQQIRNKVEEALKEYKPGDFKPVSFVSAKNTDVKRVQFVYMGEEIKAPKAAETPAEKPAKKGIIEKIGDLFKWQK